MEIKRLYLKASNPVALVTYFSENLGLKKCAEGDIPGLCVGSTRLFFESAHQAVPYHFAFDISFDKGAEALAALKPFATPLPDPDTGEEMVQFPAWNAASIYFFDPAGNVVELIARRNLRLQSHGRFGEGHIHHVSEIGAAVPHVRAAFDKLHHGLGLMRYSGNFHNFCATGEEKGLIILSGQGRNWFPTEQPSLTAPFRMHGSHLGKEFQLSFNREAGIEITAM